MNKINLSCVVRGTLNSKYETPYWIHNIIGEYEEVFKNKIEPKINKKSATPEKDIRNILNTIRPDRP